MQATKAALSSLHSNVPSSVLVNVNVASLVATAAGWPVRVVSGAVRSIVHDHVAGVGSTLPNASSALT